MSSANSNDLKSTTSSVFDQLGEEKIKAVIAAFYQLAFADGIIGHFFFSHDIAHITKQQQDFAVAMLGGPSRYRGKPLITAHQNLSIHNAHFGRRQVLMKAVLADFKVPENCAQEWLEREESLRPLILKSL